MRLKIAVMLLRMLGIKGLAWRVCFYANSSGKSVIFPRSGDDVSRTYIDSCHIIVPTTQISPGTE